jgi:hypothetical protein
MRPPIENEKRKRKAEGNVTHAEMPARIRLEIVKSRHFAFPAISRDSSPITRARLRAIANVRAILISPPVGEFRAGLDRMTLDNLQKMSNPRLAILIRERVYSQRALSHEMMYR